MTSTATLGGWDVHTHIIPPAVVSAGENGLYGMRASNRQRCEFVRTGFRCKRFRRSIGSWNG